MARARGQNKPPIVQLVEESQPVKQARKRNRLPRLRGADPETLVEYLQATLRPRQREPSFDMRESEGLLNSLDRFRRREYDIGNDSVIESTDEEPEEQPQRRFTLFKNRPEWARRHRYR